MNDCGLIRELSEVRIIEVLTKRRRSLWVFNLPLEFVFIIFRKLNNFVLNSAQLSIVQKLGGGFSCGIGLSIQNDGFMEIGNDFSGGNFLQLSTYSHGQLIIGKRCFFGDSSKIISDNSNIFIGDDCLVAEHVSIRASNHGMKRECLINRQPNICKDISIGNDVWIGKGVMILAGSKIPDGVVIGANSVVPSTFQLEAYCVYAGNPIKKIRVR